jgi:hypothetical protein
VTAGSVPRPFVTGFTQGPPIFQQAAPPASGNDNKGQGDAAPQAAVSFADAPVNATFYFPSDRSSRYLWLKTCADSARNLVNGHDARVQDQALILLCGKAAPFTELGLSASFYLPTDARRTTLWTKISESAARNPASGDSRQMGEKFIVLLD